MKEVLVLGCGFIGSNLVEECLDQGIMVNVLDRGTCPKEFEGKVKWHQGQFSEAQDVKNAIGNSEVVFHLISSTVPGDQVDESLELFGNLSQTLQMLRSCVEKKVRRVVFVSSSSVYGVQEKLPISENALPCPISAHGIQKLTLENYLYLFERENGLECKSVRLSNPYGEGQNINGRQGFISILLGNMINNRTTFVRGDGSTIRDFVYVSDVIDPLMKLGTEKTDARIFNIGLGKGFSLNDVIREVESLSGKTMKVEYGGERIVDIPESVLDITLANEELEYTPKVSLHAGIEKFLKFHDLIN